MSGLRIPGVPVATLGQPGGVATLNDDGHVPAAQAAPYIPDSIWLSAAEASRGAQVTLGEFSGLPALVIPNGHTFGAAAIRFVSRLPKSWAAYGSRIWWGVADEAAGDVALRSRFVGNSVGLEAGASVPSLVTTENQIVAAPAPGVLAVTLSPTTRTAPAGKPVWVQWERRGVAGEGDTLAAAIYVIGVELVRVG